MPNIFYTNCYHAILNASFKIKILSYRYEENSLAACMQVLLLGVNCNESVF